MHVLERALARHCSTTCPGVKLHALHGSISCPLRDLSLTWPTCNFRAAEEISYNPTCSDQDLNVAIRAKDFILATLQHAPQSAQGSFSLPWGGLALSDLKKGNPYNCYQLLKHAQESQESQESNRSNHFGISKSWVSRCLRIWGRPCFTFSTRPSAHGFEGFLQMMELKAGEA